MAKTLKDFLEGYLKVKSADEQKFIDKHVTAKNPDRSGNGDDVFNGKTKTIDRRKERHGYNPGEDEKVYEETEQLDELGLIVPRRDNLVSLKQHSFGDSGDSKLKGGQKKLDKNKNGKLDADDFKKLRKEEAEQIDELSTATLQSYRKKARAQGNAIVDKMKMGGGDWSKDQKDTKTLRKRAAGAQASGKQLVKRGESLKTEEAEQIDELDRQLGGTLSRYINKTAGDEKREKGRQLALSKRWGDTKYGTPEPKVRGVDRFKEETELQEGDGTGTYSVNSKHKKHNELVKAGFKHQAFKHGDGKVMHTYWSPGYRNADLQKVLGEEAEQIDELSRKTLGSYIKKAQGTVVTNTAAMVDSDSDLDRKTNAARKVGNRLKGVNSAVNRMTKEEVEDLDENAKVVAHLQKRYGDNIRKSHVRSAANDFGVGYVALAHAVRKKLGVNRLEEELIDEAGYSAKAARAGKDLGKPGKNFSKIANKAAAKYGSKASGERVAGAVLAKLRKEEKLAEMISDLSESHQRTMMNVFEKLNEDNKSKFLQACDTPEGVEQMLDFAINHRGE